MTLNLSGAAPARYPSPMQVQVTRLSGNPPITKPMHSLESTREKWPDLRYFNLLLRSSILVMIRTARPRKINGCDPMRIAALGVRPFQGCSLINGFTIFLPHEKLSSIWHPYHFAWFDRVLPLTIRGNFDPRFFRNFQHWNWNITLIDIVTLGC